MRTPYGMIAIYSTLFLALPFSTAVAGWTAGGTAICTAWSDQAYPVSTSDESGGAIVAWEDYRNGSADIYAQRFDRYGTVLWATDGVPICTASGNQDHVKIIPDGSGGAIMTWQDKRNGSDYNLYAQRVDGSGAALWTPDGVAFCTASANQQEPEIVSDGSEGAIITWYDYRSERWNIYARRVDASGTPLGIINGVIICNTTGDQVCPKIVSDNAGGAIIAWRDGRGGTENDIYAQRVDASGTTLWTPQGVAVCSAPLNQGYPVIASDGSDGAFIAWEDWRSSDWDIYAQKLDGAGVPLWTADGLPVCRISGEQTDQAIAPDGQGGVIIAWDDGRDEDGDIYAQRINGSGSPLWNYNGNLVCGAFGEQQVPVIATGESGGAVVAWVDARDYDWYGDIYAQRLDGSGNAVWTSDGKAVCTAPEIQFSVDFVTQDGGGVLITWCDVRSGYFDIYAQRLETAYGQWGNLEPTITSVADIPEDQGGFVAIDWEASSRDIHHQQLITGYSVWRATTPMATLRLGVSHETNLTEIGPDFQGPAYRVEARNSGNYFWEWVGYQVAFYLPGYSFTTPTRHDSTGVDPGTHYFQIVAHTNDQYVFWASEPDSGCSVDNLAPGAPLRLAGERMDPNVVLDWSRSMLHDEDLSLYRIYRDVESGFEPAPAFLIGTAIDTTFVDSDPEHEVTSYYLVTAVDIHENEGEPSNELEIPSSASTPDVPAEFGLAARMPNPSGPPTRIVYQIPDGARPDRTVIRVYDVSGRLVRTLVDRGHSAGTYDATWDGADECGAAVGSGVYLIRLEWMGRVATRTMVLLR